MEISLLYYPVVYIMYYVFAIIYPLFRSSRIASGKETDENKIVVLKFW